MIDAEFEFDVAFSFLEKDENLAAQICALLKDRVRCFIYTEQQKKLAGRDGEELFNKVFSKESRIVVVLFRNDWSKTPWTKIEETAVRNRGFEHGYDFVTFIPLEKPVVPVWLPKNRLWVGLEKWGIESAASVIESRIQEFGGDIKIETVTDKVQKAQQEIENGQNRTRILTSYEGIKLVQAEWKNLIESFKQQIEEIKSSLTDWHLNIRDNQNQGIDIISYGHYLTIQYYPSNTPEGSYIFISFWNGVFDERGYRTNPFHDYKQLGVDYLKFDINKQNEYGWSIKDSGKKFKSTKSVVDSWLIKFFEIIKKHRLEKNY